MSDLGEKVENFCSARERLEKCAYNNVAYYINECKKIIAGNLSFDDSELKKEIVRSGWTENVESIGYGIYWDICVEKIKEYYHSSPIDIKRDELFATMSEVCKTQRAFFDFREGKWKRNER